MLLSDARRTVMRILKLLLAAAGAACVGYGAYVTAAWFRYGKARKGRAARGDALLDRFMPDYDVCERHQIAIAAPVEVTFEAAQQLELEGSPLVHAIFKARELLMGAKADAGERPRGFLAQVKAIGWGTLAERPGREIAMGAVTKPWEPNPVFHALPPEAFAGFAEPDNVKIVWSVGAVPTLDGGSLFRTETRAVALGAGGRRKFRRYWALLSPGILLIRSIMVRALKTAALRLWRLEGDDIIADARAQLTHAVTIDAAPADVWPWLLQMGCQRGGWYSWDLLDNAGLRSADRIIPELQNLEVGDVLPARPVGDEGFEVLRIVPGRALVLGGASPRWTGTWAFVLEPVGPDKTRLVTRYRAAYPPSRQMSVLVPALTALHAVMERKQLRTIKHHAEQLHAA
jgi:hypothetical protein